MLYLSRSMARSTQTLRARNGHPRATRRSTRSLPALVDRHTLYEASVQNVGFELDFIQRVYRSLRGRPFHLFREDFCGTAALAAAFVRRRRSNRAWGVDLHAPTLKWAEKHRLPLLGKARERLTLIESDVRAVTKPLVDVVAALNYSYWVLKRRADLVAYFRAVHRSLRPQGIMVMDLFGGEGAAIVLEEHSRIRGARDLMGRRLPPFTYIWEHQEYNPVHGDLLCHIHFDRLPGGRSMRRAFTYDWRMWSMVELREALIEAGFHAAHAYIQRWDEKTSEPLDQFRRRARFDNEDAWLAYIVAER